MLPNQEYMKTETRHRFKHKWQKKKKRITSECKLTSPTTVTYNTRELRLSVQLCEVLCREYRMKNISFADNITKSQISRDLNLNLGGSMLNFDIKGVKVFSSHERKT